MPTIKGTSSIASDHALQKQIKATTFPPNFVEKCNIGKLHRAVFTHHIERQVESILGFEDEIVSSTAVNLFLPERGPDEDPHADFWDVDPRRAQLDLVGFLGEEQSAKFAADLWTMMLGAQDCPNGIPKALVEKKKEEMRRQREERERAAAAAQRAQAAQQAAAAPRLGAAGQGRRDDRDYGRGGRGRDDFRRGHDDRRYDNRYDDRRGGYGGGGGGRYDDRYDDRRRYDDGRRDGYYGGRGGGYDDRRGGGGDWRREGRPPSGGGGGGRVRRVRPPGPVRRRPRQGGREAGEGPPEEREGRREQIGVEAPQPVPVVLAVGVPVPLVAQQPVVLEVEEPELQLERRVEVGVEEQEQERELLEVAFEVPVGLLGEARRGRRPRGEQGRRWRGEEEGIRRGRRQVGVAAEGQGQGEGQERVEVVRPPVRRGEEGRRPSPLNFGGPRTDRIEVQGAGRGED